MKTVVIVNRTRDSVLASNVGVADQWWLRARGFLGRPEPKSGEGLLLSPCRAVHMVGMPYALDVLFLDRKGAVIALYPALGPGRRSSWHARARYAVEVTVGSIAASRTGIGDLIAWLPGDRASGNGTDTANTHAPAGAPAGGNED
jgi:uncharacterized protein